MADRGAFRRRGRPHRGHGLRLHRGRFIGADDLHPFRADASLIADARRHPHSIADRPGVAVGRYPGAHLHDGPGRRVGVDLGARFKPSAHVKPSAQFQPGPRLKPGAHRKLPASNKLPARLRLDTLRKRPARDSLVARFGPGISYRDPVVDGSVIDPSRDA